MPSQPYFTAAVGSKGPTQRTLSTLSSGGLPAIKDADHSEPNIERVSMQSAPGGYNGLHRPHSSTGLSTTSYMRGVMHQQAANRVSSSTWLTPSSLQHQQQHAGAMQHAVQPQGQVV
jgi:hypothetical protein